MPKPKSGIYYPPKPAKEETDQFNNRVAAIKKIQKQLCSPHDLHFTEVYDLIEKVKYMRKCCKAFNSKFRVIKEIP